MRLDKLTIGSRKSSPTHRFKNLKNVTIDFDQEHRITVVIGWNGTGKSNVLEALAIIFRDLIEKVRIPAFAYQLDYRMGSGKNQRYIHIDADPDRNKDSILIQVRNPRPIKQLDVANSILGIGEKAQKTLHGDSIRLSAFLKGDVEYLPRYVFSYYSGESQRMHEVFRPYLETYDGKLRNGEDPGLKRLFYAMPVHSKFVLLAFLIQQSDVVREFLDDHLGLNANEGIESVLFVLRQPPWKSKAPDGDSRFWNARGVVRDFLSRLYEIALAPIEVSRRVPTSIWNEKTLQFKYLFVKNMEALRRLVGDQEPAAFFRDLESTYVSELIDDVRIRVRLRSSDGSVTFRELSEGEQQLLTVLGLLRFTAENESLFLLDEPDTHLNPRWSVDYIAYLKKFIENGTDQEETSHVVMTTHNPLSIADLKLEQVQILSRSEQSSSGSIAASYPEMAPRGMGYAAIVTSDMFGIASSLDSSTQLLLEKQRAYSAMADLSDIEQLDLDKVNDELSRLGFRYSHPDDEFSRYLRLRNEALKAHLKVTAPVMIAKGAIAMTREDRESLATKLIDRLVQEESDHMGGDGR